MAKELLYVVKLFNSKVAPFHEGYLLVHVGYLLVPEGYLNVKKGVRGNMLVRTTF